MKKQPPLHTHKREGEGKERLSCKSCLEQLYGDV